MKKLIYVAVIAVVSFGLVSFASAQSSNCNEQNVSSVALGQNNQKVTELQKCLSWYGFSVSTTGYYGVKTQKAVKDFYKTVANIVSNGLSFGSKGVQAIKNLIAGAVTPVRVAGGGIQRVSSKADLQQYLASANNARSYGFGTMAMGGKAVMESALGAPATQTTQADNGSAGRVSDTNVQVKGIDEPDIIKTDGTNIYFSKAPGYIGIDLVPMASGVNSKMMQPSYTQSNVSVISAFPPESIAVASRIDASGDLLLVKDKKILATFAYQKISGYDVSDAKNPKKLWDYKVDDSTSIVTSRLYNGKIYLVTRQYMNSYQDPCPIRPLWRGGTDAIVIPCIEMYRPTRVIPVDSVYVAAILDPQTGDIEKKISFVGSWQDSVVYMSPTALYITYYAQEDSTKLAVRAIDETATDLFPADIIARFKRMQSYDISDGAKLTEFQYILSSHESTLSNDDRLKFENEYTKRLGDYLKLHRREIEKTTIVKVSLDTFEVAQTGVVPGYPLNQFSLDEYNGNLRIAVTVGERSAWIFGNVARESVNDVYVLDSNMAIAGQVQNLGAGERIYSARFIGNRGYIVTFRQIDPFFVLDLSNPTNPTLQGQLKIPGYSSYLEPLSETSVLGVGQESSQVKAAIFDVSDPANPRQIDTYNMKEYWSEVLSNHHAFLNDTKHNIFFLPGGSGGYVFSYKDNKLSLLKAISGYSVKRALYLDDYLYVVSENKIVVLDENIWKEVKTFDLQ